MQLICLICVIVIESTLAVHPHHCGVISKYECIVAQFNFLGIFEKKQIIFSQSRKQIERPPPSIQQPQKILNHPSFENR